MANPNAMTMSSMYSQYSQVSAGSLQNTAAMAQLNTVWLKRKR